MLSLERSVRKFLHDHVDPGVFAPDAVRTLIAAFDGAWQSIIASGAKLSGQQSELTNYLQSTSLNRLATASLTRGGCATAPYFTWLNQICGPTGNKLGHPHRGAVFALNRRIFGFLHA